MLSLLALTLAGQLLDPSILSSPSTLPQGLPPPFFEFAPLSGAGMTDACACTTPTGSKGETLTFTRTGNATCSKRGLATTGIQDGDLVYCAGNQPRVMPAPDGVMGLLVESSRSNSLVRSQDFAQTPWTKDLGAGGSLTHSETAPDGTSTASRLVCAAGVTCRVFQSFSAGTVTYAGSLYVRGKSGSGTVYISGLVGGGTTACPYVASAWSRCTMKTNSAFATNYFVIGCEGGPYGYPASCPASDVLIWGAQAEASGLYATSYIPTTTAAASRSREYAYFVGPTWPGLGVGSMAASIAPNSSIDYATILQASTSSSPPTNGQNQFMLFSNGTFGASYQCFLGNSTPTVYRSGNAAPTPPLDGPHRGSCLVAGGLMRGRFDTNDMTASNPIGGTFGAETYLFLGPSNTIISRVCRDSSPTRCR